MPAGRGGQVSRALLEGAPERKKQRPVGLPGGLSTGRLCSAGVGCTLLGSGQGVCTCARRWPEVFMAVTLVQWGLCDFCVLS